VGVGVLFLCMGIPPHGLFKKWINPKDLHNSKCSMWDAKRLVSVGVLILHMVIPPHGLL
jgi:hypothetical protein